MSTQASRNGRVLTSNEARLVVVAFLCSTLLSSVGIAWAGSAYGSKTWYSASTTVGYLTFEQQSGIHTNHSNNHSAHASTSLFTTPYTSVPEGEMGVQPRRFNSTGGLLCTGSWHYNGGSNIGTSASGCFINGHSTFASQGKTRAWNSSSFRESTTALSPNQNS